jgi:F0F1-type ATP synthase membrane subunit a
LHGNKNFLKSSLAQAIFKHKLIFNFTMNQEKFFDFSNPIAFFVGILELVSDISKIISFAFRLFGNIFAIKNIVVVLPEPATQSPITLWFSFIAFKISFC